MSERTVSLGNMVFASNATTVIPTTPQAGVTYRDETYNSQKAGDGWPYYRVCNSAEFNQMMFRLTSMVDEMEKTGVLIWSSQTDYPPLGIARDPVDDVFYEALQPSGPNNGGSKQPSANIGTYWKKVEMGSGGYEVRFISSNISSAITNCLYFCTTGNLSIALPTTNLEDGMKIKIASGGSVSTSNPINIVGSIENDTSLIIDDAYSSVELIYNETASMWRVCTPQIGNDVYLRRNAFNILVATSSLTAEDGQEIFTGNGNLTITLPTSDLVSGSCVKVATGNGVSASSAVIIAGVFLGGETQIIITTPNSSVEFIYDLTNGIWQVASPITPFEINQ